MMCDISLNPVCPCAGTGSKPTTVYATRFCTPSVGHAAKQLFFSGIPARGPAKPSTRNSLRRRDVPHR